MKLAILGTGYVGLVSGVCLASVGHRVTCFDINESAINDLNQGISPIYEPGLDELLDLHTDNLLFKVLNHVNERSIMDFDAVLVAVGTPTVNGRADLSQIESVARMLGQQIRLSSKFISIIIKSTVLPGTTDTFFKKIVEEESGKKLGDFGLGMNPEFLREGNAVEDFLAPDRIVFGYEDSATLSRLCDIYKPWDCDKLEVNSRSAEMMKYVNNALLATLISTVNEYSNIARAITNIDFEKVMHGVQLDNRWSPVDNNGVRVRPKIIDYLSAGCGYGGSCFPKDVAAISSLASDLSITAPLLSAVISVNEKQPRVVIDILKKEVVDLSSKAVLLLGLAFKPNTDDVRESVSLKLLSELSVQAKKVYAHDPIAIPNAKKSLNFDQNIEYTSNWRDKLVDVDVVVIATNWPEYRDLSEYLDSLEGKTVFDTRSLISASEVPNTQYLSVS